MGNAYPHIGSVRNLVFEGGGVKGIAYLGAIKRLYQDIQPSAIQGAGGSSAGAITALAVSFGLDAQATIAIADSLDFAKIRQQPTEDDFPDLNFAEKAAIDAASHIFGDDVWSMYALFHNYGWYSSSYFYSWLKKTIGAQLDSEGLETFAQYKAGMESKLGRYIDLRVHTTDVSNQSTKILSVATTPDLEVATAVRMSMSIPMFFNAITHDNRVFCDGGVIANYPIDLFGGGGNRIETLGFHLCTPTTTCAGSNSPNDDPPAPQKSCGAPQPIDGLRSYIEALFEAMLVAPSEVHPEDVDRTIEISNYCVSTTDFNIARETADYNGLFNSGYSAVDRFLTDYDPKGMTCR